MPSFAVGVLHFVEGLLPGKLRRVDADDGQTGLLILIMPTPQLRDDVFTIDSAIGPEFHQDDSAFKARDGQRLAVDPIDTGDVGCRRADRE